MMSETNSVDTTNPVRTLTSTARVVFVISGLITLVVGVLLLVWPERSAELTVGAFSIYAVSVGVIGLVLGVFGRGLVSWRRGGHALIGLLLMVAGIVALSGVDPTRTNTGTILGVVVGIVWIIQGVFSVAETDRSKDTLWSIIFGVVSVLAGVAVLIAPLWGTEMLWIFFGVTLVVIGLAQLARGQRIGDWTSNPVRPERAAPSAKTSAPTGASRKTSTPKTPTPKAAVPDAPAAPAPTPTAGSPAAERPETTGSGTPKPWIPDPSGPASGPVTPSGPTPTEPGDATSK